MKITLITGNQPRHNYLINKLSKISKKLFVIQEVTSHRFINKSNLQNKKTLKEKYFNKVYKAEIKIFGFLSVKGKNLELLNLPKSEINNYSLKSIKNFLNSNLYVVFGSSIIKGELLNFLLKKKSINIHMGISPYYRGTDCNFWALYDENPHLVGASIIKLSKEIDGGDIYYHNISPYKKDSFEYTMNSVKDAIDNLCKVITKNKISSFNPVKQNLNLTIKKTFKKDFNDKVIRNYNKKKIIIKKNLRSDELINYDLLKIICKN